MFALPGQPIKNTFDDVDMSAYPTVDRSDCASWTDGSSVRECEAYGPSRVHMPVPVVNPSSMAVSRGATPVCGDAGRIIFRSIPPHIDPVTGKCMERELQESNPFIVPRKHEQVLITRSHQRYNIPPLNTTQFPHWVSPPDHIQTDPRQGGWLDMTHPDGTLYFHKGFHGRNGLCSIFTEDYLYGEEMLKEATLFAMYIWEHVGGKIGCEDYDVVINVKVDCGANKVIWSYYFIDHVQRMPFWMRPYSPACSMRTTETLGASSPDHYRYLLKAMYWEHCSLFPRHSRGIRIFPDDAYTELTTMLSWCAAQSVISPIRYTAPYTVEEAIHLREQVDYLRNNKEDLEHYTEVAGRTMGVLERWRYDFLHGTQVIRRFRGQSVLPPRQLSTSYRMLLPVLFYAPLAHLHDCRSVYLDGVLANEPEWTKHVKKLLAEWTDFVLYATILLNANLAFLSVPNAIPPSADDALPDGGNSPVTIMSCCSMLASIGSIMVGLLLIRQHRGEEIMDNPRTDKSHFMERRRSQCCGFEGLSMLYSLPYVLLMWSTIAFLIALVAFILLNTDQPTRATTVAMLSVILMMLVWCVRMGWGATQNQDFFRYRRETRPFTPVGHMTVPDMWMPGTGRTEQSSKGDAPSRTMEGMQRWSNLWPGRQGETANREDIEMTGGI
ncbi:hypothetical protein PENSPDRAFT_759673 [Peniophora sp. CONT]|nr:hypothetical protein PENSPDRAFT_759673 [Peniophora sp. CONT]